MLIDCVLFTLKIYNMATTQRNKNILDTAYPSADAFKKFVILQENCSGGQNSVNLKTFEHHFFF